MSKMTKKENINISVENHSPPQLIHQVEDHHITTFFLKKITTLGFRITLLGVENQRSSPTSIKYQSEIYLANSIFFAYQRGRPQRTWVENVLDFPDPNTIKRFFVSEDLLVNGHILHAIQSFINPDVEKLRQPPKYFF